MAMRRLSWFLVIGLFATGACDQKQAEVALVKLDWTPPATKISADYIAIARKLLGNGLSDPRGGTFSKATIRVGDAAWGGVQDVEAFGWVSKDGKKIVAVDGLTYEVAKPGTRASYSDLSKATEKNRFTRAIPVATNNPALPALLLIRGEVASAEAFGKELTLGRPYDKIQLYAHFVNRYRMQVAQCLIDRKDKGALPWAEKLAAVGQLRLGDKANYPDDTIGWKLRDDEPAQVLADIQRRIAHPRKPFDRKEVAKLEKSKRFAALAEALEDVAAKQWGQPGGISWTGEPVIDAIIAEGTDIVPVLLDVMERDNRLTRTVSFGRDFFPPRTIHTVQRAATVALISVWPSAEAVKGSDHANYVANLRSEWAKNGNLTESQRWLKVLQDDSAGPDAWYRAAQELTSPKSQSRQGGFISISPVGDKTLKGEDLREEFGGQVIQAMSARVVQMTHVKVKESTSDLHRVGSGLRFANRFARWDAKAAAPFLIKVTENAFAVMDMWTEEEYLRNNIYAPLADVLATRLKMGDRDAVADLDKLSGRYSPDFSRMEYWFKPFWVMAGDEEVDRIAAKSYARIARDLESSDFRVKNAALQCFRDLFRSPLVGVKSFREFVAQTLDNDEIVGRATVEQGPNYLSAKFQLGKDGGSGSWGIPSELKRAALIDKESNFTAGEFIGQTVTSVKGAPAFSFTLKPEPRAKALRELQAWLRDDSVDWKAIVTDLHFWDDF